MTRTNDRYVYFMMDVLPRVTRTDRRVAAEFPDCVYVRWQTRRCPHGVIATPFWDDDGGIPVAILGRDGSTVAVDHASFALRYDPQADATEYLRVMREWFAEYEHPGPRPNARPTYDESTNPSNGWEMPDAFTHSLAVDVSHVHPEHRAMLDRRLCDAGWTPRRDDCPTSYAYATAEYDEDALYAVAADFPDAQFTVEDA